MSSDNHDEQIAILTNVTRLQIPQGQQSKFKIKLSAQPEGKTYVAVNRTGGDAGVEIVSANPLKFTKRNYNKWKTVTLAAELDEVDGDGIG